MYFTPKGDRTIIRMNLAFLMVVLRPKCDRKQFFSQKSAIFCQKSLQIENKCLLLRNN